MSAGTSSREKRAGVSTVPPLRRYEQSLASLPPFSADSTQPSRSAGLLDSLPSECPAYASAQKSAASLTTQRPRAHTQPVRHSAQGRDSTDNPRRGKRPARD